MTAVPPPAPVLCAGLVQSYNEVLLADRTFHNPHALEEMAAAFRLGDPRLQAR